MIKIELTSEEKYRLERVSKAGKGQISFRANIILLNNTGMSAPAIATMLGITHQTALSWINKYQKDGLDVLNGEWFYYICDKKRTTEFTEYLSQIEQTHPIGTITIIADNGPAHISKGTAKWFEKHPRMRLLFLPKYSPQLNPVEKVWWFLKNRLFANRCYPCFEDIEAVIHRSFVKLQPVNILQLSPINI